MSEGEKVIYSLPGVYDSLEHVGDVYIKARGGNLLELFESAGVALFDTMTDTSKVSGIIERAVEAEGFDLENLLYRWLESLLLLYYSENLVCSSINVQEFRAERASSGLQYSVRGKALCELFNQEKHEPRVEVKSPTYSLMRILKTEHEWIAYFVLDI
ncbi:MAG: archease [Desulfurococcaceae archaeon]